MILITGGGSGIGRALARDLANQGETVLIIGRRVEALQETKDGFANIDYLVSDVRQLDATLALLRGYFAKARPLKAIVHNAGTIEPIASWMTVEQQAWRDAFATQVHAPLFISQALRTYCASKAKILHIGTGAAHFPIQGWAAYCSSKAALYRLTQIMQLETPVETLAISSVMPGIIDTDMQALIRAVKLQHPMPMEQTKLDFFENLHREGRLLQAETVAAFLRYLLQLPNAVFAEREWDIYDETHHAAWLKPPHKVPAI